MYESYFGLSGKPFQLSPDPGFYFGSRGHRRAMAYLEYGLHQAEGFIIITGEIGAGKSTLVQQLLRTLPVNNVVPVQIVTTQLDAEDLLRVVASAFGIPTDASDKSTLLIRLEQHLRRLQQEGRRALLIVDEAQNLGARAIEELRMLTNFQIGTQAILQSFLLGQPELRDMMQRPEMRQLKQRIIAAYHLGPLDRTETRQYIEHRLSRAGWKGDPAFADEAFDRIFAVSNGIPRRINTLADRLLLNAFLSEKHAIQAADVNDVASELQLELGPRRTVVGPNADDGAAPIEGPPATNGLVEHKRVVPLGASTPGTSSLEERVAILEGATTMIFGTLKRVLRLLRNQVVEPQHARETEDDRQRRRESP